MQMSYRLAILFRGSVWGCQTRNRIYSTHTLMAARCLRAMRSVDNMQTCCWNLAVATPAIRPKLDFFHLLDPQTYLFAFGDNRKVSLMVSLAPTGRPQDQAMCSFFRLGCSLKIPWRRYCRIIEPRYVSFQYYYWNFLHHAHIWRLWVAWAGILNTWPGI
jgi:hypothetical protein